MKNRMEKAEENKRPSGGLLVRLLLLVILLVATAVFVYRMVSYHELRKEAESLEQRKAALKESIEQMERDLGRELDQEEIIRIAREKFNLAFPEDTVYFDGN